MVLNIQTCRECWCGVAVKLLERPKFKVPFSLVGDIGLVRFNLNYLVMIE